LIWLLPVTILYLTSFLLLVKQTNGLGSFLVLLSPLLGFFLIWFYRVWNDPAKANFTNTMWLNFLSALCLNAFFVWFFLETSHILQL